MATIELSISGNAIAKLESLETRLRRVVIPTILARTLARARSDLSRLYVRHLKRSIRGSVRRRTGALLRLRILRQQSGRFTIEFLPTFPQTAYFTARNKGRRGASKQGQYAFVLNSSRLFIEGANHDFINDPEAKRIIAKHLAYIISQYELRV